MRVGDIVLLVCEQLETIVVLKKGDGYFLSITSVNLKEKELVLYYGTRCAEVIGNLCWDVE